MPLCGEAHNLSSPNKFQEDCVHIRVAVLTEGRSGLLRKNRWHFTSDRSTPGGGIFQAACYLDNKASEADHVSSASLSNKLLFSSTVCIELTCLAQDTSRGENLGFSFCIFRAAVSITERELIVYEGMDEISLGEIGPTLEHSLVVLQQN